MSTTTFGNLIGACHPDRLISQNNQILCTACDNRIILNDVHAYVLAECHATADHLRSGQLAEAYAYWTANLNLPMTFPLVNIPGIKDSIVPPQSYVHVRSSIELLRLINAPFVRGGYSSAPATEMLTKNFISIFLGIVSSKSSEVDPTEFKMLNYIMTGMRKVIDSNIYDNLFQLYIEQLVPFVQLFVRDHDAPLLEPVPSNLCVTRQIMSLLQQSAEIRRIYGRFSIPFDVVHVMVGCFATSSNMSLVANWILDFMARICVGDYFWQSWSSTDHSLVKAMDQTLQNHVTPNKNITLYYVVKNIREGKSDETLSNMWNHYIELVNLVHEKFIAPKSMNLTEKECNTVCNQLFPAVLFGDNADYYGFMTAFSHVFMSINLKEGQVQKGAFHKAKEIHRVVRDFINKVKFFQQTGPMIWTLDTLNLFLAGKETVEKTISDIAELLIHEGEELQSRKHHEKAKKTKESR